MRIFLVIDETRFYHPSFVAGFLKKTTDEVVGAALVTEIPAKSNLEIYLKEHWYYLRPSEMAKLAFNKYTMAAKDLFGKKSKTAPFYSVRSVFEFFKIDFVEIRKNINKKEYLDAIKSKKPDVIASANSLFFGKELLKISRICCINRHSSLLPSYAGLWPVFQAYRCGEEYVGASIHMMDENIDNGTLLTQKKVRIEKNDTVTSLYSKCFEASVDVLLESIEKIKRGDFTPFAQNNPPSYFSFPTKEHWQEFRDKGGRFI